MTPAASAINHASMVAEPVPSHGPASSSSHEEVTLSDVMRELMAVKHMVMKWMPRQGMSFSAARQLEQEGPVSLADEAAAGGYQHGKLKGWIEDRGFGFAVVDGCDIFIPYAAMRGPEPQVGQWVILKVIDDPKKGPGKRRATECWSEAGFMKNAAEVAAREASARATRAAEVAAKCASMNAAQTEQLIATVNRAQALSTPPGLSTPKGLDMQCDWLQCSKADAVINASEKAESSVSCAPLHVATSVGEKNMENGADTQRDQLRCDDLASVPREVVVTEGVKDRMDRHGLGFTIRSSPPGVITISNVDAGGWADRVGLQRGSRIINVGSIDAHPLEKTVWKDMLRCRPLKMLVLPPASACKKGQQWKRATAPASPAVANGLFGGSPSDASMGGNKGGATAAAAMASLFGSAATAPANPVAASKKDDLSTTCSSISCDNSMQDALAVGESMLGDRFNIGTPEVQAGDMEPLELNALTAEQISDFIEKYGIDEEAKRALEGASSSVQDRIYLKAVGPHIRNPSAYVKRLVTNMTREEQHEEQEGWQEQQEQQVQQRHEQRDQQESWYEPQEQQHEQANWSEQQGGWHEQQEQQNEQANWSEQQEGWQEQQEQQERQKHEQREQQEGWHEPQEQQNEQANWSEQQEGQHERQARQEQQHNWSEQQESWQEPEQEQWELSAINDDDDDGNDNDDDGQNHNDDNHSVDDEW